MAVATIVLQDEVNVRIKNIDPDTLKKIQERITYYVPGFMFMQKYKIGRWDGKIRLCTATGKTYLNLLDRLLPILSDYGYQVSIVDQRRQQEPIEIEPVYEDSYSEYIFKGEPLVLRDYQVDAINTCLTHGQGVFEIGTGAGKTLICAVLAKVYEPFGNVVVIVPTIDLAVQTRYTFQAIGIQTGLWYGEIKDRQTVTMATWQSLDHFPELFGGAVAFIVDEVQGAKGKVLNEMLTGPGAHVPFRYGCTGTLPKEELFRTQIQAAIGPSFFQKRTWELQKEGVLADAQIYQIVLNDSKNKSYLRAAEFHEDWHDFLDWVFTDAARTKFIADYIHEVSQTGNTLVLVNRRKHGKILQKLIPGSISLDGGDKPKDRQGHFIAVNEATNAVLICTSGIAAVGIDIPRLFHLILLEPGRSFIRVLQSLGRGVRRTEDKNLLVMHDICGDCHGSDKQRKERLTIYKEAKQFCEVVFTEYT